MNKYTLRNKALGAVVGSAVGDALGAPFEFGPAGACSDRFQSRTEAISTAQFFSATLRGIGR